MTHAYASVYLSPHADDAVFSCAGRIWEQHRRGLPILIATIATGDPKSELSRFARRLHSRCGMAPDSVNLRRQEDQVACEILGTDLVEGQLQDAIYRSHPETGKPMYPSLKRIFKRVHPADTEFPAAIERLIGDLPGHEELVVPLAVGNHVDHLLVRAAAESVASAPLLFYEDFPYSAQRRARDRVLKTRKSWTPEVVPLSLEALAAKHLAAAAYTSQVDLIFGNSRRLRRALQRQQRILGGERYWRCQPQRDEAS